MTQGERERDVRISYARATERTLHFREGKLIFSQEMILAAGENRKNNAFMTSDVKIEMGLSKNIPIDKLLARIQHTLKEAHKANLISNCDLANGSALC